MQRLLYFLNALLLLALLFACLSCFISPSLAWPLSFFGLGFPLLAIMGIFFLLIWGVWKNKFFWVNVIALILCLPFIRTVFSFHFLHGQEKGLKLMSYNVRNFDLYNWSGNKKTRRKIMDLIRQENPDILCLQEFFTDEEFQNMEYLRDSLGYKYYHIHVTYDKWFKNTSQMKWYHQIWGLAIFSRYEITDTGVVRFNEKEGNQCFFANLNIKGKSLRVYDTHLQSMYLNYNDYDAIEELSENQNAQWYKIKSILGKMKRAYTKRAMQAAEVHDHVSAYQGQKIVCGDFNDAPVSYSYQKISNGLHDAFIERGTGFGKSFDTRVGLFRIDFILPDPSIRVNSYRSVAKALSDHYPIISTLSL